MCSLELGLQFLFESFCCDASGILGLSRLFIRFRAHFETRLDVFFSRKDDERRSKVTPSRRFDKISHQNLIRSFLARATTSLAATPNSDTAQSIDDDTERSRRVSSSALMMPVHVSSNSAAEFHDERECRGSSTLFEGCC